MSLLRITCSIFLLSPFSLLAFPCEDANAILSHMTLEEKIGQLFIAPVYPDQAASDHEQECVDHTAREDSHVKELRVGGILLKYRWTPLFQRHRVDRLQHLSCVPLFVAQDLEWGLGSRIDFAIRFPKNMTLGAVQDLSLIEELGREIGKQASSVGVNLVLGPVVDVNTNPNNPVIHLRSFGADKQRVADHGVAWMRGLQSSGVLACAKHFPGHGDTHQDSHELLPVVLATRERLAEVELFSFQQLIDAGVATVLTAHLSIPSLDPEPNRPSSLSPLVINGLLKGEMGFHGLVITDDLLMGAIHKLYGPGEAAKLAFLAGNDLIIASGDVNAGIETITRAVQNGEITEGQIDERVRHVLEVKEKLFASWQPIHDVWGTLMSEDAYHLCEKLYENAVTVIYGEHLIPFHAEQRIEVQQYGIAWSPLTQLFDYRYQGEVPFAADATTTLLVVFPDGAAGKNGFLSSKPLTDEQYQEVWQWVKDANDQSHMQGKQVVVVWFGSPYGLRGLPPVDALIVGYEEVVEAGEAVAKVLLGQIEAKGKLPIR